ncbi:glycoside hydrolase family 30 protein [Microvirga sp. STR05]|uniref:Glycoside hydrolase family 30 protein n=1 Tax=Hymenobacter duratus TaxID=2771356 RepID=A0ABR8JDH7_9BACT|nr:glycoside hydrolase family 30 protein [Hymenobacter duratus]MBD2714891.1 glycoside hydrolase family 30 protein [Hymenobacter duratus]MBR7949797.1 glycoside hydrolase family 30 protein [Microvirga sp. STR05]
MQNSLIPLVLASCIGTAALAQPAAPTTSYSAAGRQVQVYTTAANTQLRMAATDKLTFQPQPQPLETQPTVFVDPTHTFQTLLGIGGAMTDAAAETFAKLPKPQQQEFLQAYYSPTGGIGYTLARTTIHSSDFSSGSYTYVADGDKSLKTFSLKHDEQYRIPFIKQAQAAAGGKLTMYVSPWSPPAWMKDNKSMLQGGKLLPEFRQTWADYYVAFIKAYEKQGIPIWGLTVQNEPMAKQKWESCIFTAEEERDFVKGYLGPTLKKNGLSDKKLIGWDHNRDLIFQRAATLFDDPEASKYYWGLGFHWYETWTGSTMQFENLRRVHETYPDKNLVFTEGCVENFNYEQVTDWRLGERYGHSMINDFNAGTVAWTDWNVLLDETGGPNHVDNFCYAPIIGDTRSGKLIYTNSYYYIGHFSKFIRPGARRIATTSSRDVLQTTAFLNTNGKVAVVVMNSTEKEQPFQLWMKGQAAQATSRPHSIMTIVVN